MVTPLVAFKRTNISIMKGNTAYPFIDNGAAKLASTGDIDQNTATGGFNGTLKAPNVFLKKDDCIYVKVFATQSTNPNLPSGFPRFTVKAGSSFYNTPVATPLLLGDTMFMNSAIPKDILIKDFFTSIIKMFNLYVQPDPNNEANLLIEPLETFYNGNKTIDWTEKVDYSKEILIKPTSVIEGKDYIYRYKPDNDYYNEDYRIRNESEYGERNISIANDFVNGQKVTELIFSPTPSYGVLTNSMVIPRIIKIDQATGAVSPYDSNIRILYYGGIRAAFGSWARSYNGVNTNETTYAYAGHLDNPFAPTLDLLFDAPKQLYWGGPSNIGSNYTTNNLYNKYYSVFINEITDRNSKIVSLYARLRPLDIFELNFKNFIYISGTVYKLNKVIDYNPAIEGVCKIELVKIKGGYIFTPSTTSNTNTSQNPIKFDIVEGGKNEIRNPAAYSIVKLIDGSVDAVIGLSSSTNINILNGGKD